MGRCLVLPESVKNFLGGGLGLPSLSNTSLAHSGSPSKFTLSITYSRKPSVTAHPLLPTVLAVPLSLSVLLPCVLHTVCRETVYLSGSSRSSSQAKSVPSSYLYAQCLG